RVPPHHHHTPSGLDTAKRAVVSTFLWYVGLLIVGALLAPYPAPSAFFSIIQIVLLAGDLGDAEKSNRLLQNFLAATVNLLIGLALQDVIVWGFAILVILTVIAKTLKTE